MAVPISEPDRRARVVGAALFFVLLSGTFFGPYLAPGRVFSPIDPRQLFPWNLAAPGEPRLATPSNDLMSDALMLSLPWWSWNAQRFHAGRLPLWNPYPFCGYPHFALVQSNALYPFSLPFNLVDPVRGIGASLAFHVAMAGWLMFVFLRRAGLACDAALVGGTAFALNGFFLVRLGAPSYVYTGTWLPLWLLGAEELGGGGDHRRGVCWVSAGAFLGFLGAHPQVLTLCGGMALSYLVARRSVGAEPMRERGRSVARFVGAAAIGLGLAGFQLVPFAELLRHTLRAPVSLDAVGRAALPAVGLLQGLIPDAFGHPVDGTYWLDRVARASAPATGAPAVWGLNYCGENLYTGLLPLALAAVSLARPRGWREVLFGLLGIAAVAVLVGSPLLALAYWVVPGFRYSRPDRIVFVYAAATSVLAAYGYARVAERGRDSSPPSVWLVVIGAVLLAGTILRQVVQDDRVLEASAQALTTIGQALRSQPGLLAGWIAESCAVASVIGLACIARARPRARILLGGVTIAALVVPLARFGWKFNPPQRMPLLPPTVVDSVLASPARVARIQQQAGLLYPANATQLAGIFDVHGASAAALSAYGQLIRAVEPGAVIGDKYFLSLATYSEATKRLLDLLAVRFVLSDAPLPLAEVWAEPAGRAYVYENPDPLPRFYLVGRVEPFASESEARRRLLDPAFDVRRAALVPDGARVALDGAGSDPIGEVRVERYEPEEIVLRVSAPGATLLVSSEVDYPGWTATVDDEPAPVVTANTAFRAVRLPAGDHRVELRYAPRSLRWGAALSLASALLLFGWMRVGRRGAVRP